LHISTPSHGHPFQRTIHVFTTNTTRINDQLNDDSGSQPEAWDIIWARTRSRSDSTCVGPTGPARTRYLVGSILLSPRTPASRIGGGSEDNGGRDSWMHASCLYTLESRTRVYMLLARASLSLRTAERKEGRACVLVEESSCLEELVYICSSLHGRQMSE